MIFNRIVLWIAAIGCLIGGLDRVLGNRFGLGEKFEEGLKSMGPLALAMGGLICLSPVFAKFLGPLISPAFEAIGCDPAMFGAILPSDTGGFPLAMSLAKSEEAGYYSGLIVASMFGAALTFMIPVGFSLIEKKDAPYYARGMLIGMIAVPFGCIFGGLLAGFSLSMVLVNIIPIAIMVILICLGLKLFPNQMIRGCEYFGKLIVIICTVGFACAGFESLSGFPLIPGMSGIDEAMAIIGQIAVVLMGFMPVISLFLRAANGALEKIGRKVGMNAAASAGFFVSFVNPIPFLSMYKDMNPKGKIVTAAVVASSSAAFGDLLGFTAAANADYIFPVVVGKCFGSAVALILALLLTKNAEPCDRKIMEETT